MNINFLGLSNLNEIMYIFRTCFKDDHYYIKNNIDIEKDCIDAIKYCLTNVFALGAYVYKQLAGFILVFDYSKLSNDNIINIFGMNSKIQNELSQIKDKNIFILSIAVHPDYQRNGIGSLLLNQIYNIYNHYYITTDVSNPLSLSMYKKLNFDIKEIDEDYYFVMHKPEGAK